MEGKILKAVQKYQMQDIYSGTILAFSGGADSCALLHFLSTRCKNLVCVHINHMIRGEEAQRDEDFARATANKYGVKFISHKIDIPKISAERKSGLEQTAREERYKVLYDELSKNPKCKCIVTAHNADDNLETVLFNLARGTGVTGIAGIKPVYNNVMRPLIYLSKKEIIDYCLANNIEYVTDSTNFDTTYTRNHIRHKVVPALKEINPRLLDSASRLGELLTYDEEYFKAQIDKIISEYKIEKSIPLSLAHSLEYSILSRLLRRVSGIALDYTATGLCIDLIKNGQTGAYINLSSDVCIKLEHECAVFLKSDELKGAEFCSELKLGLNYIDEIGVVIALGQDDEPNGYQKTAEIKLNSEKINGTLFTRSRKNGDKIKAGKMTKRLKQLFVDNHIPSHMRDKIPLICLDDNIICVPNIALADGYKGDDFIIKIFKKED